MNKAEVSYFPTLDGWRAIAILGVILSHSTSFFFAPEESGNPLFRILILGSNGVDLFFAISGFLICSRILEREETAGTVRLLQFYRKRIFRIFPLYFFYLFFLYALVSFSWLEIPKDQIHYSFLFLQNYHIKAGSWHYALAHFWSLAVEEHFYLFFPILLFLLPKTYSRRILSLLILALTIAVWRFLDFRNGYMNSLIPDLSFFMRSDTRMDALLFGCIGALVNRCQDLRAHLLKAIHFRGSSLIFASIFLSTSIVSIPFSLTIKGISATLLILSTVLRPQFCGFLEWRWMRFIGVMSYSLYVWNSFFLWPGYLDAIPYFGFIQRAPLNYLFLFLVSYLTYRFLEKPVIQLGNRIWRD